MSGTGISGTSRINCTYIISTFWPVSSSSTISQNTEITPTRANTPSTSTCNYIQCSYGKSVFIFFCCVTNISIFQIKRTRGERNRMTIQELSVIIWRLKARVILAKKLSENEQLEYLRNLERLQKALERECER